jgi:hypothetical protein
MLLSTVLLLLALPRVASLPAEARVLTDHTADSNDIYSPLVNMAAAESLAAFRRWQGVLKWAGPRGLAACTAHALNCSQGYPLHAWQGARLTRTFWLLLKRLGGQQS